MSWNPALGTQTLVNRLGKKNAAQVLVDLLSGRVSGPDLVWSANRDVLLDIGNGHARRLMDDATGMRLAYWPKVWAARSMAYLGDVGVVPALSEAVDSDHWRVRMTAIQTLGRLGARGCTSLLVPFLDDDHPRVRRAAIIALGRVGDEEAVEPLSIEMSRADGGGEIETAVGRIEKRLQDGFSG